MQKHTKNYLEYFGLSPGDFISCEWCGAAAVDLHHIVRRSSFGSKRKEEQDNVKNLIALCRKCHDDADSGKLSKCELQDKHNQNL